MLFNPDPNLQAIRMLFSPKRVDQNHPPLFFNNIPVGSVIDHKHLGIILDCELLFTKHISEKVTRRWYRRLLQFYKIVNDLAPSYLTDIIPPLRRSLYGPPRHVFHEIRCYSFTFMHSFFRIVSNPGTILEVNLRRYHLSPNSKKLY